MIALDPEFVKVSGNNCGIFLSQLSYWKDKGKAPDGWIYKTSDELKEETGLTYKQQSLARRQLRTAGVLEDKYKRLEHTIYFRLNSEALHKLVSAAKGGGQLPHRLKGGSGTDLSALSPSTRLASPPPAPPGFRYTESTAEITAETTTETPPTSSEEEAFDSSFLKNLPPPPACALQGEPCTAPPAAPSVSAQQRTFPKSNNPEFPKLRGTKIPNWAAAVAKFDSMSTGLPQLFPGFVWHEDQKLARKYYEWRKDGRIQDRHIALLVVHFHAARCEEYPEWRPRSMRGLMETFQEVMDVVTTHARKELEYLEHCFRTLRDGNPVDTQAEFARTYAAVAGVTDLHAFQQGLQNSLGNRLWWPVIAATVLRGGSVTLLGAERNQAMLQLADDPCALELIRSKGVDIQRAFGFSANDVTEERTKRVKILQIEMQLRRRLLELPLSHSTTE